MNITEHILFLYVQTQDHSVQTLQFSVYLRTMPLCNEQKK